MAKESEGGWRSARSDYPSAVSSSAPGPGPSGETVLKAIRNSEVGLFAQDRDLRYVWTFNVAGGWLEHVRPGVGDDDVLPPDTAELTRRIKTSLLHDGEHVRYELVVDGPSGVRIYDVRLDADRDADGAIVGIVGTSIDITGQKQREDTLKTLLRELSHRSKNLLAIIQSLASQTARHSVTVPEFLVRFRGRIQSLSSSQDIVTDSDWRGADLFGLVMSQVERYAPDGRDQISLRGRDVYLSPSAALHVGLALHELAVNAASYGSLSTRAGIVMIHSAVVPGDGEQHLQLNWQEKSGPRVALDPDTRFGTSTLERIVPNSVGGQASLTYHPDGISYTLTIPSAHFELIDQAAG